MRRLASTSICRLFIAFVVALALTGVESLQGQNTPALPESGQHSWSHQGRENGRGALLPSTGPEAPVLEPPEWPYPQVNGSIEAAPVVDASGTAYIGSTGGTFYAVQSSATRTSQLQRWSFNARAPIASAAAVKPIAEDRPAKRVYFTTKNGRVYSLSTGGKKIWEHKMTIERAQAPVGTESSPALVTAPGSGGKLMRIYVATTKGIYALEETGQASNPQVQVLWRESNVSSSQSVAIGPEGNQIFVAEGKTLYALDADPRSEDQVLDKVKLGGRLTGPIVDGKGDTYVGSTNGYVYRYTLTTGSSELTKVAQQRFSDEIRHSPALAPGKRLAVRSGDLYLTDRSLNGIQGKGEWRLETGTQSVPWYPASKLVVDGQGTVFVAGNDRKLHAVRNGSAVWSHPISGQTYTAPALTRDGRLYMATDAPNLHVIQSDPSFQLAFGSDRTGGSKLDIHTIRSAYGSTGSLRQLTDDPAMDTRPAYSPLGRWLAFASNRGGSGDVWLGTASAKNLKNLNTGQPNSPFGDESRETDPAFSPVDRQGRSLLPNGKRYLAVTTNARGNWGLFFVNLDQYKATGNVRGLNLQSFLREQGLPGASVSSQQAQLAFSPDGTKLAYGECETNRSGLHGFNRYRLRVVYLEEQKISSVTTKMTWGCGKAAHFHPFFSPDGRYLTYEKDGALYLTDTKYKQGTPVQSGMAITSTSAPRNPKLSPAWSPDGTEIVFDSKRVLPPSPANPPPPRALHVLYGPDYSNSSSVSTDMSTHGAYHPRRLPEPETQIARCKPKQNPPPIAPTAPTGPTTLEPSSQRPGGTVTIRGCGFDIRFPENNTVVFPRADGNGVVQAQAYDAAVEPSTGLGLIKVEVPMLAGDGQLRVDTPFGGSHQINATFRVEPLASDLRMDETVPNAYVRILGYGFETGSPGSYQVQFAGGKTAGPAQIRLEECKQPETPCQLSQVSSGDMPASSEIGWIEVQVPGNVSPGPVTVERSIGIASPSDRPQQPLSLLTPEVFIPPRDRRNSGSAGDPAANIAPVQFTMEGREFPYDPYFGYTEVNLEQVDPNGQDRPLTRVSGQGNTASIEDGTFSTTQLEVQPNTGGKLQMVARLPSAGNSATAASGGVGTLAQASVQYSTPLKNLPIIFIPGTSGAFVERDLPGKPKIQPKGGRSCAGINAIRNVVSMFWERGGRTLESFIAMNLPGTGTSSHDPNDYLPTPPPKTRKGFSPYWTPQRGHTWINFHGLVHMLSGCANWLDPIHLSPSSNQPPPRYPNMEIGDVIKKITLPGNLPDKTMYASLFEFMRNSMGRQIVPYGKSCSGNQPCTYLFNEDWRKGMQSQSERLDELVEKALQETGEPKVAIITHSYGGPTAKYYLRTQSNAPNKVDQIITLGGGHTGVVTPYKILEIGSHWGFDYGPFKLKDQKPQQMGRDWPTAYWQLPQSNWGLDGSNGHGNVNTICPWDRSGKRNCGWIKAWWDPTSVRLPIGRPTQGQLKVFGNGTPPYSFIEDATALNPFRGRSPKKFAENINDSDGATAHQIRGLYGLGAPFSDKYGTARNNLLELGASQNNSTLSCSQFQNTGLGDWRCGTQGVFFHRLVGWGKPTHTRVHFTSKVTCLETSAMEGVCEDKRGIHAEKGLEGDNIVPLRSAVGILEDDGVFDSRDSRIWGLDGYKKQDYTGDGEDDGLNMHRYWPQMPSAQKFIKHSIEGTLTDITQLPSQWPSQKWPFKSPCGVPDRPRSVLKEKKCGEPGMTMIVSQSGQRNQTLGDDPYYAATPILEDGHRGPSPPTSPRPDPAQEDTATGYWVIDLRSEASLSVRNDEGERAGPMPELPGVEAKTLPGIEYVRDPGRTHVYLPDKSGEYDLRIEGTEAIARDGRPDLAELRIYPLGEQSAGPVHVFHAFPVEARTVGRLSLDTEGDVREPILRLNVDSAGEATRRGPDATLTGPEVGDRTAPTVEIQVRDNELRIEAQDEGGSGVYRIYYGTSRGRTSPTVYEGPVELPENTKYVWASAVDRAGNAASEPATYSTCQLPMDFNGNGQVEQSDVQSVVARWLSQDLAPFDLNGIGPVDIGDIQYAAASVGEECPSGLPSAPDPARRKETNASLKVRDDHSVNVGDTTTVELLLQNPKDVAGIEAVLSYSELLELTDVSLPSRLEETGRNFQMLGPRMDSTTSVSGYGVTLGAYSMEQEEGLRDDAVVARLTFTARDTGRAALRVFEAQVSDTRGVISRPARGGAEIEVMSLDEESETERDPEPDPDSGGIDFSGKREVGEKIRGIAPAPN